MCVCECVREREREGVCVCVGVSWEGNSFFVLDDLGQIYDFEYLFVSTPFTFISIDLLS